MSNSNHHKKINIESVKHFVKHFPTSILITTPDPHIVYANPSWEELTGYRLEEVLGENPRILQSGKTQKHIFKNMWDTITQGKHFSSEDIINKRKDGTEYQIHSIVFPIMHKGKIAHYVQIEDDITKRKRLDDLKNEFLSVAVHELRTPITTIKLLLQSQLLRCKKHLSPAILQTCDIDIVDREINRLTRIINDLTDVSRLELGKLKMNFRSISITDLIKDAIRQTKIIGKKYKIKYRKLPNLSVIADSDRIKQVLINILINAEKFSPPTSLIEIEVTKDQHLAVVSIKDKGIGVAKEKQKYIFNRFYQAKDTKSGFGLGLHIAKEIIEQHGGRIWVKSKLGKGSTFYFSLKLIK